MAFLCADVSRIPAKMRGVYSARSVIILCAMAVLSACKPVAWQDARERNNRIIAQAYELIDTGSFEPAAKLLREALDTYPTMARPHLDLALIQHDHMRDYISAIYHYQRYLALRPGTEKTEMIRDRILQAKEDLISDVREDLDLPSSATGPETEEASPPPEPEPDEAIASEAAQENVDQNALVTKLENDLSETRVTLAERERILEQRLERIDTLENVVKQLRRELVWARSENEAEAVAEAVATVNDMDEDVDVGTRTYAVRANDSLSVIAKRVYGDATKWRLIQDANREVLGGSEILRIGQVLEIPKLEERR